MSRQYTLKNPRRSSPEKQEERKAQKLMALLGFSHWHLSQARATRQTPGWPDAFFTHPDLGIAVWYEAKREGGKQSAAQKEFQRHASMCGYEYVVGTADVLVEWARGRGLVL